MVSYSTWQRSCNSEGYYFTCTTVTEVRLIIRCFSVRRCSSAISDVCTFILPVYIRTASTVKVTRASHTCILQLLDTARYFAQTLQQYSRVVLCDTPDTSRRYRYRRSSFRYRTTLLASFFGKVLYITWHSLDTIRAGMLKLYEEYSDIVIY